MLWEVYYNGVMVMRVHSPVPSLAIRHVALELKIPASELKAVSVPKQE